MATFEQLASPRVLRGTKATIWLATYLDGKPTAPTSAGTVTITDQDGATVASSSATIANQRLEYTLTAAQAASSAVLTASWATVVMGADAAITLTSQHEITGDLLFTLNEARAYSEGALTNQTKYPDSAILQARDRIWDEFEDILGYPLGGRVKREVLSGDGSGDLWLTYARPTEVSAIATRASGTTTWTAFTSTELADVFANDYGRLTRESLGYWTLGNRNIRITYEAGTVPIPRELKNAALTVLRYQLVASAMPDRATSFNDETGTYTLSTPGQRGAIYGLPDVDVVLTRLKMNMPGFA